MQPSKLAQFAATYQASLQAHWDKGPQLGLKSAHDLGDQAVVMGIETLQLALLHDQALSALTLPSWDADKRDVMFNRAAIFFNEVFARIEQTHPAQVSPANALNHANVALKQRTRQLAVSRASLRSHIAKRKGRDKSLKNSDLLAKSLLRNSHKLEQKLKTLKHRILAATEEARKQISLEVHDEIAQTLLGINVRLLTLQKAAAANNGVASSQITLNQRLIQKSMKSITRFAHDLGSTHKA